MSASSNKPDASARVFLTIKFHYEDRLFTLEEGTKLLEILGKSVSADNEDWSGKASTYTVVVHNEHTLMQQQVDKLLGLSSNT